MVNVWLFMPLEYQLFSNDLEYKNYMYNGKCTSDSILYEISMNDESIEIVYIYALTSGCGNLNDFSG
jgi:hypothetical protein